MENKVVIGTLHNLLDYHAARFPSAEIELRNSLHDWIDQTNSVQLKMILQKYHDFVKDHVQKLENFFEENEVGSLSFNNRVMLAYIEDTNENLANCSNPEVKDACLLACIQAINHFKIWCYGTAASFARTLELNTAAAIFQEAEINEKHIDDRLSQLAGYEINNKAKSPIALPG